MRNVGFVFALLLPMVSTAALAATSEEANKAIEEALEAKQKAASVDGEWRDTGDLINQAKKAAKDKNYDKAVKLANEAEAQGKLGYQQAIAQDKRTYPPAFLRN